MRTLASIQTIADINDIPGADNIVVATVLGWRVVIRKNEFKVGDKIIFFEIDSWIPTSLAPFLSKEPPRVFEDTPGERLRTVKLRNQISQGLILPISIFQDSPIGTDVTDQLGIKKYEAPIPTHLSGLAKGLFPDFLIKTDEDRIQIMEHILPILKDAIVVAHEKLDGTSMTVYKNRGEFGVCTRNLDLAENPDNALWKVAIKYDLPNKLMDGLCIQGELIGPGIQGNKYKLKEIDLYVFNVFDINQRKYLDTTQAKQIAQELCLNWVPYVVQMKFDEGTTSDSLLTLAEGKSQLNPDTEREGLVWRPLENISLPYMNRVSFKTISNKFLLKHED